MKTLLLIDIQNDFCAGGALEVTDGNAVVPIANKVMEYFDMIVATKDWHPADHKSFAANHLWRKPGQMIELNGLKQILWPMHCINETYGSNFVKELDADKIHKIFYKGTNPEIDSYSGFFDNGKLQSTGMGEWLKEQGVTEVYILGLATDFCVKFTALDAVQLGFTTHLIADGCRGVNFEPFDSDDAIEEMRKAGVRITDSENL